MTNHDYPDHRNGTQTVPHTGADTYAVANPHAHANAHAHTDSYTDAHTNSDAASHRNHFCRGTASVSMRDAATGG